MGRFSDIAGKFGYLYRFGLRSRIPKKACYTRPVDCPELGEQVSFVTCLRCDRHRIWHEKDIVACCWYEYRDLKSKGWYESGEEYLKHIDYESWKRVQQEKQDRESINREMEQERAQLQSRAEELQEEDSEHQEEFDEEALRSFEQFFSEVHETWEEMEKLLEERQGGNPEAIVTAVNIGSESNQEIGENQQDEQSMRIEDKDEDLDDDYDKYDEYEEEDDLF